MTVVVPEGEGAFTEEERSRQPTVFSVLREIVAAFGCADPHLGLYGAFGYDLAFQFEPVRLRLDRPRDQRDLVLHLPDEIYVVDRRREEAVVYRYEFTAGGASTAGHARETADTPEPARGRYRIFRRIPSLGVYAAMVERAKERFKCGDLFEVVPGHVFYGRCASPAAFYERLRERNPAPFEFRSTSATAGSTWSGASPEMYVRVTGDRVETCPISGTIARGTDPLEDAANIATLLGSAKEESELTMCTDVDRNDKSRVCVPGSVKVIGRRQIEMYSRLIHTVDHIEGRLRPGFDALDAFLTHMWAVTVTGAPKAWAMQFIEDNETAPRRWYGGAVGKIGFDGSMNTGLTLRTAHISGGIAAVRAGATLLYDSDPLAEEAETYIKARALIETLRESERKVAAADSADPGSAVRLADYRRTCRGRAGAAPGRCSSTTRTRSCTRSADYFRQHDAEVTTLRAGFPRRRCSTRSPRTSSCSRRGRAARRTSTATTCCPNSTRGTCPRSASAWGCRRWWSTPAGSCRCCLSRSTASRGGSWSAAGRRCSRGCRRSSPRRATTRSTRRSRPSRAASPSPRATHDGVVMAIEDEAAGRWAVQFHPESILTAAGRSGHQIIANVLALVPRQDRRLGREQLHDPPPGVVPGLLAERRRARPEERVPDPRVADQFVVHARGGQRGARSAPAARRRSARRPRRPGTGSGR